MIKEKSLIRLLILFIFLSINSDFANAQISFTQPNSGASWEIGTEQHILIENTGSDMEATVIELYNEGTWDEIIPIFSTLTNGINDITWDIDFNYSANIIYQLRILDNTYQEIIVSEIFELTTPSPQITAVSSPFLNSYWINGQDLSIGWHCYSISEVDIEYSIDNGSNWTTIVNNLSVNDGSNSTAWTISGISGINSESKVRILDSSDPDNLFRESANFILADIEQFSISQPNSSTIWEMVTEQNILLLNNGVESEPYNIELYIDGSLAESIFPSQILINGMNNILWDIPEYAASQNCQLKVMTLDEQIIVVSEIFELTAPSPQIASISSPIGNSYWYNGQVMSINWECYSVSEVDIEYTTDNGSSWTTITSNYSVNNGINNTNWTVNGIIGTNENSRIKIYDSSDPINNYLETADFILAESLGDVTITQPNLGTSWEIGTEQHILIENYTGADVEECVIMIYNEGGLVEILSDFHTLTSGINDIIWDISFSFTPSVNYYLSLMDDSFQEIAVSEFFELTELVTPQILSVSSPNSESYWYNAQEVYISWECYVIQEVNIEYSTNNGLDWLTIVNNYSVSDGDNSTYWTVNGILGINENSIIKISDSSNPENLFLESVVFTLAENSQVTITQPNIGTSWEVGSEQHILVTNNMNYDIELAAILLYIDGGMTEVILVSQTLVPGANDIIWNIGLDFLFSDNCYISLMDDNIQEIVVSEIFELTGTLIPQIVTISSPINESYWYNEQEVSINWECYSVSEVNIKYSVNNDEDWIVIVNNYSVSDGDNSTYWTVNGILGINENSRIKISDSSDPENVYLESDVFILSDISQGTIIQPNSETSWEVGTEQHILITNNMDYSIELVAIFLYDNDALENFVLASQILEPGENIVYWDIDAEYSTSENYYIVLVDNNAQIIGVSEMFELTEPININPISADFLIYPNPTSGRININNLNSNIRLAEVLNITGKTIFSKTDLQQYETIDLSNLESGVYIIRLQTDKKIFVSKIVKQ